MDFQNLDNSIILIDKPEGITSAQVLNKVKKIINQKKAGHSGTLDKAASGLLVIGIGQATKLMRYFLESKKKYSVLIKLGVITDSHDREGEILEKRNVDGISAPLIKDVIMGFKGEINQMPPLYSALKIKGKRASDLVRAGVEVELKERQISIYAIEIDDIDLNESIVKFTVECSKGTYIRSLARDIGEKLGCGASLLKLRREKLCNFSVQNAITIDQLSIAESEKQTERQFYYSPFDALSHMNKIIVDNEAALGVLNGRSFRQDQMIDFIKGKDEKKYFIILDKKNNLLAVADIDIDNWLIKYLNVFNTNICY